MKQPTKLWIKVANMDIKSAKLLFEHALYPHAIYYLAQGLEKILKASQIEYTDESPDKTHQLEKIAEKTPHKFNEDQMNLLVTFSRDYNRVRYPDLVQADYGTKRKTQPTFKKGLELYIWIKKQLSR
jgi:HEPN domain-containing protein